MDQALSPHLPPWAVHSRLLLSLFPTPTTLLLRSIYPRGVNIHTNAQGSLCEQASSFAFTLSFLCNDKIEEPEFQTITSSRSFYSLSN